MVQDDGESKEFFLEIHRQNEIRLSRQRFRKHAGLEIDALLLKRTWEMANVSRVLHVAMMQGNPQWRNMTSATAHGCHPRHKCKNTKTKKEESDYTQWGKRMHEWSRSDEWWTHNDHDEVDGWQHVLQTT